MGDGVTQSNLRMKLGIIGTRGIPNRYGGFEQFASFLGPALAERGHEVYVYNPSYHPFREKQWKGVHIISKYSPGRRIGSTAQFIYDLNCILDARLRGFDALLQLGYTSSSVWSFLFPGKSGIITNMDGMEWRRSRYSRPARWFLRYAEKRAVKGSDLLIADSQRIQQYLEEKYRKQALFIAYGATPFERPDRSLLAPFGLTPSGYHLAVCRMEPENNPEMIIRGWLLARSKTPLVIVGDCSNGFGKYLRRTYARPDILFAGGIYDPQALNNLRFFSRLYFHGHSVGGTNPSLLEAMACRCLIAAHGNEFNRFVLGENAFYFEDAEEVAALLKREPDKNGYAAFTANNLQKIRENYSWQRITDQVEDCIIQLKLP